MTVEVFYIVGIILLMNSISLILNILSHRTVINLADMVWLIWAYTSSFCHELFTTGVCEGCVAINLTVFVRTQHTSGRFTRIVILKRIYVFGTYWSVNEFHKILATLYSEPILLFRVRINTCCHHHRKKF